MPTAIKGKNKQKEKKKLHKNNIGLISSELSHVEIRHYSHYNFQIILKIAMLFSVSQESVKEHTLALSYATVPLLLPQSHCSFLQKEAIDLIQYKG